MTVSEMYEALGLLVAKPFDAATFPFEFLEAFNVAKATLNKFRKGTTPLSELGGYVVANRLHLLIAPASELESSLEALEVSTETTKKKARLLVVTDGVRVLVKDRIEGTFADAALAQVDDYFSLLMVLGGVETVASTSDSSVDVKATKKLTALYVELQKANPSWVTPEGAVRMNHFLARLIFCLFAEDTQIFRTPDLFTTTLKNFGGRDESQVRPILEAIFHALRYPDPERAAYALPGWTNAFPYVNGGLFEEAIAVPEFTRLARILLLDIAELDWASINPDIFGSMIQVITDPNQRAAAGAHYTSVPNIMKVLGPLFLDELKEAVEAAADSPRKLLNIRNRMARIRIFDPACGSGNFLVIAYKELRALEARINALRGEESKRSVILLTNFRGIEISDFSAEIARLALIIASYQCDVQYLGQQLALADFLPLSHENWIVCGNALRLDWQEVCPPAGMQVIHTADDLFDTPLEQPLMDFENEGGEVYICGNPPFVGSQVMSKDQNEDMKAVFDGRVKNYASLDYVAAWFLKAADYGAESALVTTNSICQGRAVAALWPTIFETGCQIRFAYDSFRWKNLAANNAGVTVSIVGMTKDERRQRVLYEIQRDDSVLRREVPNINAYLISAKDIVISQRDKPLSGLSNMIFGNMPNDRGGLLLSCDDKQIVLDSIASVAYSRHLAISPEAETVSITEHRWIRRIYGSDEFINGSERYCLWLSESDLEYALEVPEIARRVESVRAFRSVSPRKATRELANSPHRFGEVRQQGREEVIIVPSVSSEQRDWLPTGLLSRGDIVTNLVFALFDAPLWNIALIASRLHLVWIGTVCGKLKTDFRYSNTLGWNTFPYPALTTQEEEALTRSAEEILLAREQHFPATIADLYDGKAMPENLRLAHEANDVLVEEIFAGKRFRNDSERLEALFARYETMIAAEARQGGKA